MLTIVWFGRDLRLADNPTLSAALARGGELLPVFILDDEDAGEWKPGAASRWWLHQSLVALSAELTRRGSTLVLRKGSAERVLDELIGVTSADAIYWSRRYEPWAVARNTRIKASLRERGIDARSFNASLLHEPGALTNQSGEPYRVFTPFWKTLRASFRPREPEPAPKRIVSPSAQIASDDIAAWELLPATPDWSTGMGSAWAPGEKGAAARAGEFLDSALLDYRDQRNQPAIDGTSRLSPHLHFGEIGPRQIWWDMTERAMQLHGIPAPAGVETFLSELAWREFSYHLLYHYPTLPDRPLRGEFANFPWSRSRRKLRAWQRGMTGYPIVDAGMRQLWTTGWMHNRVRMIVASFLIKDLMIDWREGERWFWDTLVDADLASNSANWQWVAGSGADAAPYFRVFNPSLQGKRFDPRGEYVRRWIPEISKLSDASIHTPWSATPFELEAAGIQIGVTYPSPIVDHAVAKDRALEAFNELRRNAR